MKYNGKTMSILMVINWLEYNGVMRYLTDLSNAYVEEGNKVIVISAGGNYINGLDKKVQHKVVESIPQTAKASITQTAKVIEEICLKESIFVEAELICTKVILFLIKSQHSSDWRDARSSHPSHQ